MMKERDELKKRFEGIDPDQVSKLAEEKRQLEEQQQLKAGEFEKVLEAWVRTLKGDLHKQIAGISAERDALNVRLSAIQIDQAVYRKLPGRVCVRARPRISRHGP